MDGDIHFGRLEESPPEVRHRPDDNSHYAIATCGTLQTTDLAIFVDLDVLDDIEDHAASDTSVELGGVLLGGQYEDEQGRPFVVISYSLRARHYESTKGSFKFTHDTWTEITRQREALAQDLQMVGWYHTHPGWGVFLSGMDMFICNHFFNKALDVALVIDPCRAERALFQWSGESRRRTRRVEGFYLTTSRFRQQELDVVAEYLEGEATMSQETKSSRLLNRAAPPAAPAVHITSDRSGWQTVAMLAMLTVQFVLLALIAWRGLASPAAPLAGALQQTRLASELRAEREMLDRIVGEIEAAPQGLVTELLAARRSKETMEAATAAMYREMQRLERLQGQSETEHQALNQTITRLTGQLRDLRAESTVQQEQLTALRAALADGSPGVAPGTAGGRRTGLWNWRAVGIVLLGIAAAAVTLTILRRLGRDQDWEQGNAA